MRVNDTRFAQYKTSSPIPLTELKNKNYTFGTGNGYKAAELLGNFGIRVLASDHPLDDLNNGIVDLVMIDAPIVAYYVQGKGKRATPSRTLRTIGQPLFANAAR